MAARLDLDETVYDQGRELSALSTHVGQLAEGQDRIEGKVDQVLEKLGKQDDRIIALEAAEQRRLGWRKHVGTVVTAVVTAIVMLVLGLK
jgi:hypothetical protein